MKNLALRIGAGARELRRRLLASSSFVWSGSVGIILSFYCYVWSFTMRAPLPPLWALGIAGFVALVSMLLDAGPGRLSVFARSVQYGMALAAVNFSAHARDGSLSFTFIFVAAIIYGILMALAYRFYMYDPREKTRSSAPSRPLH